MPPYRNSLTADKIGTAIGAVTVAGMAAHALSTNVRKRKLISDRIDAGRAAREEIVAGEKNDKGGDE